MVPQSVNDLLWYGFYVVFLALVWFIKKDLGEIKSDSKATRALTEANSATIQTQKAVCEERHRRLDLEIVELRRQIEEKV